ncbi:uncharacterized protein [Coffea arabica]|uniref:Uncharacterized protein isoform X14 n=1 Tax=Coffea arabica TaxID=13443 RepID=A0ABM4UGK4_COFAR
MATEDDKPQTIFATDLHLFLQETEKEVKELHTIGTPVSNHPLAEIKQVEPLHNDTDGSYESENCEMNTEPDSSNQKKAECGGSVKEESSRHSIEPTSAHSAEVNNVGRGAYFEEGGMGYNFNDTTASFEGDPHETSFQAKEANFPKISSITDDMKLDSEILHSTVSEIDEITGKGDGSDLSESTSTQTVCQSDRIEEAKENAQIAEIQPAGHVMTLTMTDSRAGTAGLGVTNYEVKSTHGTTDGGNEDVGISCHYEYPNNEDDKKEKENRDSNTEQPGNSTLVAKSMDETMSKNKDSDNVEQLEGKSSTKTEGIQDTNILSQDMEEITHNQLEILGTGCLECSISERGSSSYDRPESVRAVSDILSMSEKESQTKENHGDDTEETVQEKDEVSSGEHNSTSQSSHSMESKSGEDLEVKNVISMCPIEAANCMNDQKIRGNNVATDLEEGNRRMTESVKDNSSVQEFQMISIDNNAVDEANNPVLLPVKNNGKEASETGGKEHVSEVDDSAPIEYEDRRGLSIGKKTEDENSHNSDDTSKDREQLAISQSLGKENQPNKEDHQYEEATTPFMSPDEPLQSKADIENPQVFTIAEETEINEDKLQGEPILIEQSNEMQDILLNDHSLEKIGNKHRSREDSSCCSPLEVINQKSKQEDDLKLEVNPGVKADGTFVGTNNTKSSTKFEEPETSDATESFKIEMPTEEKFVEGPSQVLAADETEKFGTGEGKEIGSENNKTTYDDIKQEVEPEAKPNESTNNASQTSKTEEPQTIYSTQSLEKQISDEEQVIEGHHQTAEERLNDHLPEDKREKNDIDTETEDELKPEVKTGLSTDEVSDTVDEASNSKKFKEAGMIEAMQSLNNHLLSNKKVGEGPLEIAERLENYSPAEVGREKRNVKVTSEAVESKPEIYTGQKFEEPEVIEATQRINTPMSSEEQVVEGPMQVSVTENVVNYCTAEERKEKRKGIDTTGDDLNPEVDPEVKVNEVSATTSNANQSKKFEETEIYDAAQSFKKQCPPEEKGLEGAYPVSTAEEKVNYSPAEKEEEGRDVKDTAMQEELNPELATGLKLDELSESIRNASTSTKFQEPEPIDVTQTVNKQISHEEKVIEQADQVSTPEELVNYHLVEEEENVKDTTTADDLQPEVDPGVRANEIFDTKDNASESTKSLNQKRREDKVVDRPPKVSTAEAANYCSPDVKDEDNVKDATLSHELNPDVDQGENDTKASETTENASENTKFEDSETVDATQSFNRQMTREEKVVDGPPKVSTTEEAVNYCCAEEVKEEDHVKDATLSHDLNPHVVQEENATKESETTENASESTKVEQPHCIEFSQNFKKDIPHEDEIVEGLHLASTKEETVNYCNAEEVKAEGYVKETATRDEIKQELDSKLQVSENREATRVINADMETQDDVIEGAHQVSIVENVGNYRPAEERKEDNVDNVDNTTGDKLSTIIKLEETTGTDVAEILEKDNPRKDKVNEEPSQVSAGEEPANYNPTEGGKERNINDAGAQDELKPEVAPGVKLYEIYEDVNESKSTKFQQPEPSDTTQSVNKQIKREDKVVKMSPDKLPADKIVNYQLAEGVEVKNVNDRTLADENHEAKPKTESGMMADEISETHYASESTKEKMPQQDKVVTTAEQTTNQSPGQEEKEERNLNVTTISDELKPEIDPGEISPTVDNAEVGKEKRNVTVTTADESKPERHIGQKFEEPEVTDASQRTNTPMSSEEQVVEGPMQVSIEVNYCNAEERKEKRNGIDTTGADLKPEVDQEVKVDKVSATTSNASQSKKFEGTEIFDAQSPKKQSPPEDKGLEGPYPVSTAEEKINYSPAEKPEEERDVNDTAMQEELNPELAPGIKSDGLSQSIRNFQEPEPIDATETVNKKIPSKEKVVEQHDQVSTPDEILNYHLAEDKKKSVKDTSTADELQPKVNAGVRANEIFDTIDNASESIKFEDPETVDATQSLNQLTTREEKVVHGPPKVSTTEEAVNYFCKEEVKEENVNDATLSHDSNPHGVQEENDTKESETTENASESTKFKQPCCIEFTQNLKKDIPHEDEIVEGLHLSSTKEETVSYHEIVEGLHPSSTKEETVSYRNTEEVKAESYVKETTTRYELKPERDSKVELEDTNETDMAENLEKDIPRKDKVNEELSQVSAGEVSANYKPAGGGKERNVNDAATQDELKPEVAPGVKLYGLSEDMNESESKKLQEPEPIDTTQSVSKQIKEEDKVVERSPGTLPADKLVNDHLADGGEVKHVKDRTPADENLEAKPKTESRMMADEISETHYASESTKLTEAKTVDATDSFQEEQTKEGKVVEGPPKVSTAEQTITDSPGEEEKEERNLNVTTISDKLKPELDPGEISPTIDNASQITKFKGPEIVDVSPSFKKEMPSEDEIVERPPQVPTPEELVSYSPDEEGKTETNVKETTNRDYLNPEADHKMEEDEISESTNSTSKTTEFELPENIEATKGVNTQMPREDKIGERSIQVSIAKVVGSFSQEIKDKSVDNATGDESPTRIKLEGYHVNDTNQSLEKEITSKDKVAEQPFQVSTAKEQVNDIPGVGKEERNVTDAAIQDELQPEVAPGIKPDDASRTMMNASGSIKFQEPEPIDAAQSIEEQITSKDKDVEGLHHVSTMDEIVNYHHADEGEEKNVKDKAIIDELKLKVESGVKADEVSETHYASESTKFKEAETVDATSSFQEQMPKEDKVVEAPARVSTTEAVVSCRQPEEKREERNVKNTTIRDELKGEVNSHLTVSEVPETIQNASENAKFKGSEPINVTQEVPIEDKVVEGPPQVSIAEETVYYSHAEEGNAERNTNETATKDEQKARVNPEIGVEEISLTTKSESESESTQFEVPERTEAAPDINKKMPSEDKVVKELSFQVSIAEHVGNYGCTEERNEDTNVTDTTADKLATGIKVDEISSTTKVASQSTNVHENLDETEDFKKQIPTKDQVVDGTCQVSTAVELVNFSSTEEGKEEGRVMDVSKQAELNPEGAPEIKSNETSETPMNASESTKFQEPETIDATKSSHKQMTYEDRDVEGSDQISTVEGIDNYNLAQQEWNVQDTRTLDELKPEEDPGAQAETISETTYCASRSIKFEEPEAVHANHSFKIGMPADKVVKEPPQVSTAEDKVNYSPEEERKEETNVKYTKSSDDLQSEVEPGLIVNVSDVINDASQNTKNCNDQMASEDEGVEGPPQVSTAEEILSYSPTEEGKEESSVKDTSAIDELKTRVCPKEKVDEISEPTNSATETTQFEEPEIIDAAQSSKKQILSEENVVGGYCEVLTAKEIKHYTLGENVEETNVNDTSADELNTEEDIRGTVDEISVSTNNARETTKFDKTATSDATQRFKKQKPSADKVVEEPHQDPIMVETVQYCPAEEEKQQRCTMDTTTKSELQEKADKLPRRNTETEVATSNEKVEIPGVWSPKYDEGVKGSNYQEKIFKYDSEVTATASSKKLGEYIVSGAEPLKPVHEKIGDYPKSEDVAKEDINTLESHKDDTVTHYSPSESLYEMTNATGGLVLEKQEGRIDKAVSLLLSGTSRDEESNKLDKEEQYCSITQKESRKEVSSIPKGSGIKDKEKEEKVEGQESLPTWISVTKLDGDENITKSENEDKKFHNQSKNSDFPFTGQESAREFQGNIKELQRANDFNLVASKVEAESGRERKASDECEDMSSYIKSDLIPEVKVMERPREEILTKAECKEDKGQVDKIAQKGGLADLTQATNNSEDINMPYKSSIIMSDLVIMAKEDPETGIERQLLTEDKDISLMQKGQRGETLQPETEELKPGDASQAAAEAVKEEYGEKERLNNDCNDETQKFRSAISEENSESELVPEQDDREAQGQQKTINQSRLEVTRKEGPFDPVTEMDTSLLLNMQKHEGGPCCDSDKQEGGGDPNDSLIDNKNLPVQETESICAGKEDQEPVTCNEDKETEKATGGLILEEKTTTSLPNLLEVSKNENSQVSGDIISESKQTIRREGMKNGITGTSEPKEPNTDEAKDEEGEEDKQQREELGYDHPVIVEASRDIHVKASPKKSHSILSGVGSKVKHSIAKVKKAITGKSSHPKPSSPK